MRYAIIADIHGNFDALCRVLHFLLSEQGVEQTVRWYRDNGWL